MLLQRQDERGEDRLLPVHEQAGETSGHHHGDAGADSVVRRNTRGSSAHAAASADACAAACRDARTAPAANANASRHSGAYSGFADHAAAIGRHSSAPGGLLPLSNRDSRDCHSWSENQHERRYLPPTHGTGERLVFHRAHAERSFLVRVGVGFDLRSVSSSVRASLT